MSAVQVVCLDAADTLFTERSTRAEMYAEEFTARGASVEPEVMARWMQTEHDATPIGKPESPRYSPAWFNAFIGRLLERAGLSDDPSKVRRILEERFLDPRSYIVFGDVFPCLDALQERGLRLAVISNWSAALHDLLDGLGLSRYFELVAISAVVGHDKPDPRLFDWALERLATPAKHACHVGDSLRNDVQGARRAGLRSFHLDRSGLEAPEDWRLKDLSELPGRLIA